MSSTSQETILGNARIVLADRVIEHGWVAFADGRLAEFGEGSAPAFSRASARAVPLAISGSATTSMVATRGTARRNWLT